MKLAKVNRTDSKDPVSVVGIEFDHQLVSVHEPLEASQLMTDDKNNEIAVRAYFMAEARGFESGHELEDWLNAEAEVIQ